MADIHIYTDEGDPVAYPEERIADLLRHGYLTLDTLYWREGMADWEPLETFRVSARSSLRRTEPLAIVARATTSIPARRVSADPYRIVPEPRRVDAIAGVSVSPLASVPPKPTRRPRRRFRRNPQPLTFILQLLIVACLVVTGLELANGLKAYELATSTAPAVGGLEAASAEWSGGTTAASATPDNPKEPPYGDKHLFRTGRTLGYLGLGTLLLLPLPYLAWIYRTALNCLHFSSTVRLKPAWVVGDYFIPFVNLFRPCQTLQDIWRVSAHPRTWLKERNSVFIYAWWTLSIVTIAMAIEASALANTADSRNARIVADLAFLVLKGLEAAWLFGLLALVTRIIQLQRRIVAESRRRGEAADKAGSLVTSP